jgi:hypothetical protein
MFAHFLIRSEFLEFTRILKQIKEKNLATGPNLACRHSAQALQPAMAAWLNQPRGPAWVAQPTATTSLTSPRQAVGVKTRLGRSPRSGHPWWCGCHVLTSRDPSTRSSPTTPWLCGERAGQGEEVGDSPERRGDMEAERSGGAVGFLGGSKSLANNDGCSVILQLHGPKKV